MSIYSKSNGPARAAFCLLAAALLSAALCRADDVPARHHRMENRFLFVVETASVMKSRTNGIAQAVLGLLKSDIQGELRQGDTIGLWTYNDRLHADFPMQVWSRKNKGDIVANVARFLGHQHYEKQERLDKVLPQIAPLIEGSERLTVIFVFDGAQPIRGTPFDTDINDLHKQYGREFRAAHAPIVTLLVARDGAIFDYTVNYPSSVVVPHTADPLPPPQTNAPPQLVVAMPPPPPPPVEPKPPVRRIEIVMTGTNNAVRTILPAETALEPTPGTTSNIVMAVTPPPAPAASSTVPSVKPEGSAKESAPPAPVTNAPAPPATPTPPVASTPPPTSTPPATPAPAAPLPAPAPLPPAQMPVTSAPPPEPKPAVAPPLTPAPSAPMNKPSPLPAPAPLPAPIASVGQQAALFVIAFSLLTIAIVLVIFLVRRSRGGSQPSLISQSIDRPR
jgi:hypothetical protein